MTTTPSMETLLTTSRIASTAAWSADSLSPRPIQRPAARAAASVTRASSMARLRSGAWRCSITEISSGGRARRDCSRDRFRPTPGGSRRLARFTSPRRRRPVRLPTGGTVDAVMTARDRWQAAFDHAEQRDADFDTMSGLPVAPVYEPDDGEFPGEWPYTRGPSASMSRSKLSTMRMFAGFGTAPDTNRRFRELLAAGGDGLSTAFDLPTLMGRDSDDPLSIGEVGKCGVAIDTLADVEDLYRDIDLGTITTSMTINSPAP